ncbi:hypothetical protein EDD21DRAFT_405968 [Dissophora ornata]|nr:hypothetical protein EDD21DRAFT_405968 [Dissophora ornata]
MTVDLVVEQRTTTTQILLSQPIAKKAGQNAVPAPEPPLSPKQQQQQQTRATARASYDSDFSTKKENPTKNFMGRLGRNSMQQISMDSNNSNAASSPTSIRSFTITGGAITQTQQSGSGSGSAAGSTNGSVYSGHSGQFNSTSTNNSSSNKNNTLNKNTAIPPPLSIIPTHPVAHSPQQYPVPMSSEANGMPIPSPNASLNHDITTQSKPGFSGYDTHTRLEVGLPPTPFSPTQFSTPELSTPELPSSTFATPVSTAPPWSQQYLGRTDTSYPWYHRYTFTSVKHNLWQPFEQPLEQRQQLDRSLTGSAHNSGEINTQGLKNGNGSPSSKNADSLAATTSTKTTTRAITSSVSSDSDIDENRNGKTNKDGAVSPTTSSEMGALKDRLLSAITTTLTAVAVAAKQQQLLQHYHQISKSPTLEKGPQFMTEGVSIEEQGTGLISPTKKRSSIVSMNEAINCQFHVYGEQRPVVAEDEEEEGAGEDEEEVPYVAVVPRTNSSSNRHSIFVDEDTWAMDALFRSRHRQSLRLQKGADSLGDDGDEEGGDEDYEVSGTAPPEKWHYSDEEDGYDEEDEEDEDEDERKHNESEEQLVRSLEVKQPHSPLADQQQAQTEAFNQDLTSNDFVKGTENVELAPAVEDEDRRIYLQQLRAEEREARRLARLTAGESGESKKSKGKSKRKGVSGLESAFGPAAGLEIPTATTSGSSSITKKKTLRKGHSKEDRPQTLTTPVPAAQMILLTPIDLVLIRQKLFAAGNFCDTHVLHDRPCRYGQDVKQLEETQKKVAAAPVTKGAVTSTSTSTTTTTTMTTTAATATLADPNQPQKHLQSITVPTAPAVVLLEDGDDENRVVE